MESFHEWPACQVDKTQFINNANVPHFYANRKRNDVESWRAC